jgi:hypothetical protein
MAMAMNNYWKPSSEMQIDYNLFQKIFWMLQELKAELKAKQREVQYQ